MKSTKSDIIKFPYPVNFTLYLLLMALFAWHGLQGSSPRLGTPTATAALIDSLTAGSTALTTALCLTILFFNSLLVARIVNNYSIASAKSFVQTTIYLILVGAIAMPVTRLSTGLAGLLFVQSTTLLLSSIRDRTLSTDVNRKTHATLFISTFLLTLTSLIYPSAVVLIVAWFIVMAMNNNSGKEIYAAVWGTVVCTFLCSWGWWIAGNEPLFVVNDFAQKLLTPSHSSLIDTALGSNGIIKAVALWYMVLMVLAAMVVSYATMKTMRLRAAKMHADYFVVALALLATLFIPSSDSSICLIAAPVATQFIFTLFAKGNRKLSILLFTLLTLLAVAANIPGWPPQVG